MKREDLARAVVFIVVVAKADQDVGRLVDKANVNIRSGIFEFTLGVFL